MGKNDLIIANQQVELSLNSKTGFFKDIHSKETGLHHKAIPSGIWPFGFRMGDGFSPDLLRVQIDASPKCADQKMKYDLDKSGGAVRLRMDYRNMRTTSGADSGLDLTIDVTLKDGADYFLIKADVTNNGKYGLTSMYSGWGGLIAATTRKEESFAVPDWSLGTIWDNPCRSFQRRETFGYPMFGSQGIMTCGWMDLFGPDGGIGIGYLNKQELAMLFNVQSRPTILNRISPSRERGMAFNWQLFSVLHDKITEMHATTGGVYPLMPGERFCADPWILAPHSGDWHTMADIYRTEYEEYFDGDYMTWEDTHKQAKNLDLTLYQEVNIAKKGPEEFNEVPPTIARLIEKAKIEPEKVMVSIVAVWQSPLYFPDHFPCGREGMETTIELCKKIVGQLRESGVDVVMFFTHMFYNHPKANHFIKGVNTDYDHQNVIWNHIGDIACVDEEAWQDLWKREYIPGFDSLGATGVMLDQGPTQYLVCSQPEHAHGTVALKMLSSFSRGTRRQIQAFREGFTGRKPLMWTECSSDVPTRMCDIWSGWDGYPEEKGGVRHLEIVRYTFPYRITAYTAFKLDWTVTDVNECLVKSFLIGGYYGFDATEGWDESLDDVIRRNVKLLSELRDLGPGYPEGFKDTVGLTVHDRKLVARAYADGKGISVVYYAAEDVDTTIEVDRDVLGAGNGMVTLSVKLDKDFAGYQIL